MVAHTGRAGLRRHPRGAPQGGLASQSKQLAWDSQAKCRLDTFTLQDAFIHNYGSYEDLMAAHGLDIETSSARVGLK